MSLVDKIASHFQISETKMKVFRNLYWAVLGKVVILLGSLLVGIFVARYLGPEQYGLMNYVISYVALFQVFATFGLDDIEIREESKSEQDRDVIIGTAFTLKCILALITIVLVIGTALIFETDRFTQVMISVYSLSILLNSFNVVRNHFTSLVWNEYIVKTEIIRALIGYGIKIILLLIQAPLAWFIIALVFDVAILASGYCVSYRAKIDKISLWHFDKEWAKLLLKQSFPLLLSSAAIIMYQRIDQLMIGNMIDKTSVGYFSVATNFVSVLLFIPMVMSQTMSPILVRIHKSSQAEYKKKAQMVMNVTIWVCAIVSLLLSLCSYWVVLWTFGEQYLPAVAILQILSFKAITVASSSTSGQQITIEGTQKWLALRGVLGCCICVALNWLLLPKVGVIAAAIVALTANFTAGTLADAVIPSYRHIFKRQMYALFLGWKDIIHIKQLLK